MTVKIETNSPEQATLFIEILAEIERATIKHPNWPLSPVERAAIVAEEAGEVIREANHIREGGGDPDLLRMELIQTAGTCIRMITVMDKEKYNCKIDFNNQGTGKVGNGIFALFNHEDDRRFCINNSIDKA